VVRKSAFTLIELIFAIVIIAISVVSLPMMNQAVYKGVSANIVQEAIFAASTLLNEAVTAQWDENSLEPGEPNSLSRVIEIYSGTGSCETDSSKETYRQMIGHINQPLHRRCLDSNTTSPSNTDVAGVTSLSDMIHTDQNLFIDDTTDATGYKERYTSTLTVTRPANFNGSNSDIKKITVTIKNSDSLSITELTTYSSNIGEIDYHKKEY